jgi:predicted O-methyltransferase YrrM
MGVRSEQDFTPASALCSRVDLWRAADSMASEIEVSDFMYSLIRLLKPALVVETGCYTGVTTLRMARALKSNRYGRMETCDIRADFVAAMNHAAQRRSLPLAAFCMSGVELIGRFDTIDLAFIDSGGNREAEVGRVARRMKRFGVIALHDTAPHHPESRIQDSVGLPYLYMNTPRGLTLFQVR